MGKLEDALWMVRWTAGWAMEHPLIPIGVVAAVVAARWLLNRKAAVVRKAERDIAVLKEQSEGKYSDLRPLR